MSSAVAIAIYTTLFLAVGLSAIMSAVALTRRLPELIQGPIGADGPTGSPSITTGPTGRTGQIGPTGNPSVTTGPTGWTGPTGPSFPVTDSTFEVYNAPLSSGKIWTSSLAGLTANNAIIFAPTGGAPTASTTTLRFPALESVGGTDTVVYEGFTGTLSNKSHLVPSLWHSRSVRGVPPAATGGPLSGIPGAHFSSGFFTAPSNDTSGQFYATWDGTVGQYVFEIIYAQSFLIAPSAVIATPLAFNNSGSYVIYVSTVHVIDSTLDTISFKVLLTMNPGAPAAAAIPLFSYLVL